MFNLLCSQDIIWIHCYFSLCGLQKLFVHIINYYPIFKTGKKVETFIVLPVKIKDLISYIHLQQSPKVVLKEKQIQKCHELLKGSGRKMESTSLWLQKHHFKMIPSYFSLSHTSNWSLKCIVMIGVSNVGCITSPIWTLELNNLGHLWDCISQTWNKPIGIWVEA